MTLALDGGPTETGRIDVAASVAHVAVAGDVLVAVTTGGEVLAHPR